MIGPKLLPALALAASGVLLPGCGDDETTRAITDVRELEHGAASLDVSSADRFGYRKKTPTAPGGPGAMAPRDLFLWVLPEGWEEMEPTEHRILNLRAGQAECSLGQVASGDAAANVNRWRAQMGLPPLAAAEIDALPRATLLTRPAVVVDLQGTYAGMGDAPQPGYRMLARFAQFPAFAMTVKMTGPAAAVEREAAHFDAFCDSLAFNLDVLESAAGQTTNTPSGAAANAPVLPIEDAAATADAPAPAPSTFDPTRIAWDTPAGWKASGPSGMRLVTFVPADAPRTECYVTVLDGAAGGVAMNVNRWRGEMQREPLTEAEVAALPTLRVLGVASPLVEIEGAFRGMRGETIDGALMLAVVCPLATHTVFVKMVGPVEEARDARAGFVALCESLR